MHRLSFLFQYGLRSLTRSYTRTALTVVLIVFAVAVTNIVMRYTAAVMTVLKTGAWDTGLAHVQAHAAAADHTDRGISIETTLAEANAIENAARRSSEVQAVSQRIRLEGVASSGSDSVYFIGIGVKPSDELAVSPRLFTANDAGEFFKDQDKYSVVIGQGLADILKLKLGSELTLMAQTLQGSQNAIDVFVTGIVNVPLPSFSKRTVYLHYELAQELLRMSGRYSEIGVRFHDPSRASAWIDEQRVVASKDAIRLAQWYEVQPMIQTIEKIWNGMVGVITGFLFALACIAVANMILVVVNERIVEIGTLMAIGARRKLVRWIFSVEASLVGMVGGLIGTVIAVVGISLMGKFGVPFDNPFGSDQVIVYPVISVAQLLQVYGLGIVICLVASIWPSAKASNVEPVRAFRGQIA